MFTELLCDLQVRNSEELFQMRIMFLHFYKTFVSGQSGVIIFHYLEANEVKENH